MLRNLNTTLINYEKISISNTFIHISDVLVKIGNQEVVCTGIGNSEAESLTKARSEAAERYVYMTAPILRNKWRILPMHNGQNTLIQVYLRGLTTETAGFWQDVHYLTGFDSFFEKGKLLSSHGFAAHLSFAAAEIHAKNELLERFYNTYFLMNPKISLAREHEKVNNQEFWYHYCYEHQLWHVLCAHSLEKNGGWGSAVDEERVEATRKALLEATVMALSKITFGVRGNGVNFSSLFRELKQIGLCHHAPLLVDDEERFVCQASFQLD